MKIVGIIVEIVTERSYLGKFGEGKKKFWVDSREVTNCLTLPKGKVFDNIIGLKFQVDHEKGEKEGNVFWLNWDRIVEVRTLSGQPIFRNWNLCPKCRRIAKLFLKSGPFCRYCECSVSIDENRKATLAPGRLFRMSQIEEAIEAAKNTVIEANVDEETKIVQMGGYIRRHLIEMP